MVPAERPGHGLYPNESPPSEQVLLGWLKEHDAYIHPDLRIASMEGGTGWRVMCAGTIDEYGLLFSIPKTELLSTRTSSLPPLVSSFQRKTATNITILHLALCVLHEFRLGRDSPFYGYLQSLPRDTSDLLVPMFWHEPELGGEDGEEGLRWLMGTEVDRRMKRKERFGLGYADLEEFYTATSPSLPHTTAYPCPSPFTAFIHAYSLILTRAFIVDLYRPTAMVPFADILNHSAEPHTTLAADDFVCHLCGSMRICTHDILDPASPGGAWPYRLTQTGLGRKQIQAMSNLFTGEDTVELRAERPVEVGEEVWNSYGEIGDAALVADWGFAAGDYAGEGLVWTAEDLGLTVEAGQEVLKGLDRYEAQSQLPARQTQTTRESSSNSFAILAASDDPWRSHSDTSHDGSDRQVSDDEDRLIGPASSERLRAKDGELNLNLSLSGQFSFALFALIHLQSLHPALLTAGLGVPNSVWPSPARTTTGTVVDVDMLDNLRDVTREIEDTFAKINEDVDSALDPSSMSPSARTVAGAVLTFLRDRLSRMYLSDQSPEDLLGIQETLDESSRYTHMALSISIDERSLLQSTIERWEAVAAGDAEVSDREDGVSA